MLINNPVLKYQNLTGSFIRELCQETNELAALDLQNMQLQHLEKLRLAYSCSQ